MTSIEPPLPDSGVVAAVVPSGSLRPTSSAGIGTSTKSRTSIALASPHQVPVRPRTEWGSVNGLLDTTATASTTAPVPSGSSYRLSHVGGEERGPTIDGATTTFPP